MYQAIEISPDIYWVGIIDWNERNFHGYTTDRGSTYNAYLIMDEKVTLIDTCKPGFTDEMLERVRQVVDPAKIDYIIANHVEQDHSGGLPVLAQAAPNAQIFASNPKGVQGLTAHYGDLGIQGVTTGDTLEIGTRTLRFVQTTMVHWPDNMVAYSAHDKILFSNDAFGQHLATSHRFADEVGHEVMRQARKYYANIVMPYSKQVGKALDVVEGLEVGMIAPAHGVIWRGDDVPQILQTYRSWANQELDAYALVIYDSMWHTTEHMADSIVEAFTDKGINVRLLDLKCNHISDIMTEVLTAKYVAVGSPTLNATMMPTVAAFLCYLKGLTPRNSGRIGIPFGSYGWVPSGPNDVAAALEAAGYELAFGTYDHQWTADEAYLDELRDTIESQL